jgi:hypothetical protein
MELAQGLALALGLALAMGLVLDNGTGSGIQGPIEISLSLVLSQPKLDESCLELLGSCMEAAMEAA